MKRTLVIITLLAPLARGVAQQAPVIQPKITELGTVIDSAGDGSLMPEALALSPNGKLLVYTTGRDLRIWDVASRTGAVLLKGSTGYAEWSRQGDAIVFPRNAEQGSQAFVWTMRLDPVTGRPVGAAQRVSLSPTTFPTSQFSPDGKFIAYARWDTPQRSSLVVVPVTGGSERVMASGFGVRRIRWSSDGSSISYVTRRDSTGQHYQVHRVATRGGAPERVYDAGETVAAPELMADGRLLQWGPTFNDQSQRTLRDKSGAQLATLSLPVDAWSDDASGAYRVIAVREWRPRALRLVDLASGTSRFLVDSTGQASSMAWFADGLRLATLVRRNNSFHLVIFGVDGREQKNIPLAAAPRFTSTLDERFHSDLRLSPDGRYAAYVGYGRHTLELVDLTTGQQRTIARSNITTTNPVWHKDSRTIRYVLDGAVNWSDATRSVHDVTVDGVDKLVRRLPFSEFPGPATVLISENVVSAFGPPATNHIVATLDGRAPRVMLPTPAYGGQLSPDGQTLVVRFGSLASESSKRITFESLADGSVRHLDLPFTDVKFNNMQYHPDGKSLYIAGRNAPSEPVTIYSVPIDGSTPRVVARANTREPGSMFAVSRDAKYIAFVEGGLQRATFLTFDFTEGVARLEASGRRE